MSFRCRWLDRHDDYEVWFGWRRVGDYPYSLSVCARCGRRLREYNNLFGRPSPNATVGGLWSDDLPIGWPSPPQRLVPMAEAEVLAQAITAAIWQRLESQP